VSSLLYTARYKCDFCGAEADAPGPPREPMTDIPLPDGWSRIDYMMSRYGTSLKDVCGDCKQEPFGKMLEEIDSRGRG